MLNVFRDNLILKFLIPIIGAIFIVSCSKIPPCSYTGRNASSANAGCLIVHDNKLLIVEDIRGRMSLPGGGKNQGEAAHCTAEREVWEETGLKVNAVKRITTFNNGFQVFKCELAGSQKLYGSSRPWRFEIDEVHWLELNQFANKNWRFPEQVFFMKEYLKNYYNPINK